MLKNVPVPIRSTMEGIGADAEEDCHCDYSNEKRNGYISLSENGYTEISSSHVCSSTCYQSRSSYVDVHDSYSYCPSRSSSHQMYNVEGQKKKNSFHSRYRYPDSDSDDTNLYLTSNRIRTLQHRTQQNLRPADCISSVDDNDCVSNSSIAENGNGIDNQHHSEIVDSYHIDFEHKRGEERAMLIDNSSLHYVPIHLERSGVKCMCRPDVIQHPSFLCIVDLIDADVVSCLKVLPKSVHNLVRRTKLWINLGPYYTYGKIENPTIAKHTTTHHHTQWLIEHNDNPMKCHGIEFYNVLDYCFRMRYHWNCCGGLLLHEYCHIIHQFVLSLDNKAITQLYKSSKASGKYRKVMRRDWADRPNPTDLAYGMVDAKEFFAEFSVTYLSRGYRKLDNDPCDNIFSASPILVEPTLLSRLAKTKNDRIMTNNCIQPDIHRNNFHLLDGHCNKFYPFTAGQFEHYDKQLFEAFDDIWKIISTRWIDTNTEQSHNFSLANETSGCVKYIEYYNIDNSLRYTKDCHQLLQSCRSKCNSKGDTTGCECCCKWFSIFVSEGPTTYLEVIEDCEFSFENDSNHHVDLSESEYIETDGGNDTGFRNMLNEGITLDETYKRSHQMEVSMNFDCKEDLNTPLLAKKVDIHTGTFICCKHRRLFEAETNLDYSHASDTVDL